MKKFIIICMVAAISSSCACYRLSNNLGINRTKDSELFAPAGFTYIEAGIARDLVPDQDESVWAENRDNLKDLPLPVIAANGFYPKTAQLVGPEADESANLAYAEVAFRRGQEVGIKYYVLGSGKARNVPEGMNREECRAQFESYLKKLGDIAAKYDAVVVIEPLRSQETNFINTVREGAEICREVNNPHICVLADFYHMAEMNEGPESIEAAGKWLKHCHIAEKGTRRAPGTDGQDFTPYFRALKKINYRGHLSTECKWKDFPSEAAPSVAETRRQLKEVKY